MDVIAFFACFVWWLLLFVFVFGWFFWFDLALRRPQRTMYLVLHWHGYLGPSLHQDGWHNLPFALINELHATACWSTWRKLRGDGRKKKDDGCQRLGLLSIWLWRSEILKSNWCHVESGCETVFSGAPCIYGGRRLFLHHDGFWYIVLSCEKSYHGMYSFLICDIFSWIEAVW